MSSVFSSDVSALEAADSSGDQLSSLKAQKRILTMLLKEMLESEDKDYRELTQIMTTMSRTSIEIVRLEGLIRDFDPKEEEELDKADAFRKIFGKEGVGLE